MNPIRAFVGHSFTPDDKDVVRTFLDFFNTVKTLNLGFEWEHAEEAEPSDLRDKVLRIADEKNLFIGICTNKENVLGAQTKIRKIIGPLQWAENIKIESKTSDWVIQEIGFAIGRRMDLILLVEEGVRRPGGLQGNIEYISFNRASPEKAFPQILQMIRSLQPTGAVSVSQQTSDLKPENNEFVEQQKANDEKSLENPDASWKTSDYEFKLFVAAVTRDWDRFDRIYNGFLETADGRDEKLAQRWKARRCLLKIRFGNENLLNELEKISHESHNDPEVLRHLADSFSFFKEPQRAIDTLVKAEQLEGNRDKKLICYEKILEQLLALNNEAEAQVILERARDLCANIPDLKPRLMQMIRDFGDKTGKHDLYYGASEQLLHSSPADTWVRFKAAYKYSDNGNEKMALLHYLRVPPGLRDASTWNNLGVSSARLKLDCKAVAAYRVAETKNETLALSNLAKKLLNAGFEPEARALCEQAQKMPNVNDAIAETLLSISQATEDEEKKQDQILKESKPVQDFFIQFGDAASLQLPKRAEGIWKGNRCALNFVVENGRLTANGEYTVKSGIGLINSIMAGPGGGGALEANPRRMIVKISGYTYGCAAICELSISEEGKRQPATLLGAASDKEKLLLALSSDCSNALAYEANAPESVQIYQLTHITAA